MSITGSPLSGMDIETSIRNSHLCFVYVGFLCVFFLISSHLSVIVRVRSHMVRNPGYQLQGFLSALPPCSLHGCLCSCWLAKEICMFSPLVHIFANNAEDLVDYTRQFFHCNTYFTLKVEKNS